MSITLPPLTTFSMTNTVMGVAASSDGSVLYAALGMNATYGLMKSTNSGAGWAGVVTPGSSPFTLLGVACSADGSVVYASSAAGLINSTNSGAGWTTLTGAIGNGRQTSNINNLACSADGNTIIATVTQYDSILYLSPNRGGTWTTMTIANGAPSYVACSSDASVIYAFLSNFPYRYTVATGWVAIPGTLVNGNPLQTNWKSITCNANGSTVFMAFPDTYTDASAGIYVSVKGATVSHLTGVYNLQYIAMASSGQSLVSYNLADPQQMVNPLFATYYVTGVVPPSCLLKGARIECEVGSRPIETLRKGMRIKTTNGIRAIHSIGWARVGKPTAEEDRLYVYRPSEWPQLTSDLVMTGGHSVLLKTCTEEQVRRIVKNLGKIYMTDGYVRLPAWLDDRARPYEGEGVVYHLAVESESPDDNTGMYANGGLVETCQQSVLASKMTVDSW